MGFKLPNLGRCREVTVSGIRVVDDLTTVHGGGCSADECIADALKTCENVCEFAKRYKLFFHGNDDPAKSKTVAIINLFDDQGARIYRDVKLPVFTKQGMKCIPTLQHGKSHKILGVQVHNSHCLTAVTTFHAALDIFEARILGDRGNTRDRVGHNAPNRAHYRAVGDASVADTPSPH